MGGEKEMEEKREIQLGKKASDTCALCHADSQNLVPDLNLCQVALDLVSRLSPDGT